MDWSCGDRFVQAPEAIVRLDSHRSRLTLLHCRKLCLDQPDKDDEQDHYNVVDGQTPRFR